MGNSERHTGSHGHITHGPTTTLVDRALEFVCTHLPSWRDDPDRPHEESEHRLNLHLCDYLDRSARFDLPAVRFTREEPQTGRRSVDLAAKPVVKVEIRGRGYTIYHAFLVLEGKRLPAPTTDREQEYVSGGRRMTGGIQRFKLGAHGAELDVVAMVGYVQEGSLRDWLNNVNTWIADRAKASTDDGCTWDAGEVLAMISEDASKRLGSFRSKHRRTGSRSAIVDIYHFWIEMYVR